MNFNADCYFVTKLYVTLYISDMHFNKFCKNITELLRFYILYFNNNACVVHELFFLKNKIKCFSNLL